MLRGVRSGLLSRGEGEELGVSALTQEAAEVLSPNKLEDVIVKVESVYVKQDSRFHPAPDQRLLEQSVSVQFARRQGGWGLPEGKTMRCLDRPVLSISLWIHEYPLRFLASAAPLPPIEGAAANGVNLLSGAH